MFKTKLFRLFALAVIGLPLAIVTGCTFMRSSGAALQSTDHFIVSSDDSRVLFEPGAKQYAEKIASYLSTAIQQVEEKQYRPFAAPVRVYICSSPESFTRMYGSDVSAGVLTKLFLSSRVFNENDEITKLYLMHELSHLHLRDQLGNYKMSRLPFWFREGLATYVSGGGGAHTVSEYEAIKFIITDKYFVPNERGGLVFQNTPSDWDLQPQMFYRQSEMFMKYLASLNENAFRQLLLSAQNGDLLPVALEKAYNKNLEMLWEGFLLDTKIKAHNLN